MRFGVIFWGVVFDCEGDDRIVAWFGLWEIVSVSPCVDGWPESVFGIQGVGSMYGYWGKKDSSI